MAYVSLALFSGNLPVPARIPVFNEGGLVIRGDIRPNTVPASVLVVIDGTEWYGTSKLV